MADVANNVTRLLYLITEDWFFCSHFLARAQAAQAAGFEVVVAAREQQHGEMIRAAGLRFVPLPFVRRSVNPLRELWQLWLIWRLYRRERPDIVHQIAVKPILYGSLAARLAGVKAIVNAPVGMGYVFSSQDRGARLLRPWLRLAYRRLLNPVGSRVVFENVDDLDSFIAEGAVRREAAVLIRGAGVDVAYFRPLLPLAEAEALPAISTTPVVMLVARMLRDKGVFEFVSAAQQLHAAGVSARFVLVGDPDPQNPAALSEQLLRDWHGQQGVEWWGRREDMAQVYAQADIVCLPSYREGLPKTLLEAAACGKPLVATDVPGCREIVIDGQNGLLVPPRDVPALAAALHRLLDAPALRNEYGRAGRALVETAFADAIVIGQTLTLYATMQNMYCDSQE